MSSVNAISCADLNNDGFTDLIIGGNKFEFSPQFERLDASFGDVLINDKRGNFNCLEPAQSGLQLEGEIRDIAQLKNGNKTSFLFLRNDDYPALYEMKNQAGK